MPKKYVDENIVIREDIVIAMSLFVPRFGNSQDIELTKQYADLVNLLSLQKKDAARQKALKAIVKTNAARKAQIKRKEQRILWLLEKIK